MLHFARDTNDRTFAIRDSGSIKSTLLRCTNSLETLDGGEILLDGVPLARDERSLREMRRRMGMVFQNFELFPHKTVLLNGLAWPGAT